MEPRALVLAIALALPSVAGAQEVLTVEEALAGALERSPVVAASRARVESARAELLEAGLRVPGNPELSIELATDALGADEGESARGIAISQELWAPGQRAARLESAKAALRAAELDGEWAERVVAADVARAYARLDSAQRKREVVAELGATLEEIASATERLRDAGSLSVFDRNRVRIEAAGSRVELAGADADVAAARIELELATGRSLPPNVRVLETPPDEVVRAVAMGGDGDLATRPDVAAATAAVASAEAAILVERRERWPRPTLLAGWERERTVIGGDAFSGFAFPDEIGIDDTGSMARIELTFAIPVLDRRRGAIARAVAHRSLAEAEARRVTLQATADRDALVAREARLAQAWSAMDAAREAVRDNRRILREAWAAGAMPLAQVLAERERVLRASLQLEDLRGELVEARVALAGLAVEPPGRDAGAQSGAHR